MHPITEYYFQGRPKSIWNLRANAPLSIAPVNKSFYKILVQLLCWWIVNSVTFPILNQFRQLFIWSCWKIYRFEIESILFPIQKSKRTIIKNLMSVNVTTTQHFNKIAIPSETHSSPISFSNYLNFGLY